MNFAMVSFSFSCMHINLSKVAWHIGNRHTPCQILENRLLIQDDVVMRDLLKKLGARVPKGLPKFSLNEIEQKAELLKSNKIVLKAQIHAGGRGKGGGVKIANGRE